MDLAVGARSNAGPNRTAAVGLEPEGIPPAVFPFYAEITISRRVLLSFCRSFNRVLTGPLAYSDSDSQFVLVITLYNLIIKAIIC